jgi:hypothetical protein
MDSGWSTKAQQPAKPKPARDQFAGDRGTPPTAPAVAFDGARALKYLRELCDIGPRISGSAGMKRQQERIKTHFEKLGAKVEFQRFKATQVSRPNAAVEMANIIISWHPERTRRVLLCSHYDTRPRADQEPNPRKRDEPFVSANDGTSGVALFMELAHHMKQLPTAVGVDFVLFDGEEYVFDGPRGSDRYFFGSEHFADEYKQHPPAHRYAGAVLLDLFAGKKPRYPYEWNSISAAPALAEQIWNIAAELHVEAFQKAPGPQVNDDHIALLRAGIPAVDVIDFDYPHWHKLSDLPEQCSAGSLADMAKVLTTWLQRAR